MRRGTQGLPEKETQEFLVVLEFGISDGKEKERQQSNPLRLGQSCSFVDDGARDRITRETAIYNFILIV